MVGCTVYIVRFNLDADDVLKRSFSNDKVSIPTAPSLGLLLDRVTFEAYNRRSEHLKPIDFAGVEVCLCACVCACVLASACVRVCFRMYTCVCVCVWFCVFV